MLVFFSVFIFGCPEDGNVALREFSESNSTIQRIRISNLSSKARRFTCTRRFWSSAVSISVKCFRLVWPLKGNGRRHSYQCGQNIIYCLNYILYIFAFSSASKNTHTHKTGPLGRESEGHNRNWAVQLWGVQSVSRVPLYGRDCIAARRCHRTSWSCQRLLWNRPQGKLEHRQDLRTHKHKSA